MQRGPGRPPSGDVLTPAEWEVLHMVRHGMSNRRIAALRGTTLDAVKFHLENIREKLGLPTRQAMRHWDGLPRPLNHRRNPMPATGSTTVALGHIARSPTP